MFSSADLMSLHRSLRDECVLSIYVDRSAEDPAAQHAWRALIDGRMAKLREELRESPADEREQFERCVTLAADALATFGPMAGSPGWVAFITVDGIRDARALAVGAPTSAMWSKGAWLAPCLRDIKEDRPVVVVSADARHALISVYRNGIVEQADKIHAHHGVGNPPLHMGGPGRQNFHPGTRGTTGRDAAQHAALAGRDQMLGEVVERVTHLAGADAWILAGGITPTREQLYAHLASAVPSRVCELESLDMHASDAEIAEAARAGASALRELSDAERIHAIADASGAHGLGAVGRAATKVALDRACVRDLYLTARFLNEHADDAEAAVHAALDQDAGVEQVSGSAAELLDGLGGIAASLRFQPMPARASVAA